MTAVRVATGAPVRAFNTTITPALTGYPVGALLLVATGCLLNTGTAPAATIGNWTRSSPNTFATHTSLYTTIAQTTSDLMPPLAWADWCWAIAWAVTGIATTSYVNSSREGFSNQTTNAGSTSNTGSFTPTADNCYCVHIANKNKTSASDATVFSAASGFSIITQSVAASVRPAFIISEWFQSTKALIDTSSCVGTVGDGTTQPTQGIKIAFNPGAGTPTFAPYPPRRASAVFTPYDTYE
jgi:hypothetical protein